MFVQGSQSSLAAAEEIDWKFKVCFSRQSCLEEDVCAEEAAWPVCREQRSCTEAVLSHLPHQHCSQRLSVTPQLRGALLSLHTRNCALALAVSKNLGFTSKFPTHLAVAGASGHTAVVEALASPKLCSVLTGITALVSGVVPLPVPGEVLGGSWWCPRHPSCCRADPCPWRSSHLLPTDFWGCVSAEMAETPLRGCSPEVQQQDSAPKPFLPQGLSTAVGAQPQGTTCVCRHHNLEPKR